jgi:hypothetical protein
MELEVSWSVSAVVTYRATLSLEQLTLDLEPRHQEEMRHRLEAGEDPRQVLDDYPWLTLPDHEEMANETDYVVDERTIEEVKKA